MTIRLLGSPRPGSPGPRSPVAEEQVAALVALAYELLDAHADTADLIAADRSADGSDPDWGAHLAYLRDLQRVGRETLARTAAG